MKLFIKHFTIVLLLTASGIVESRAQNIDSLKTALKNAKHDTTRCYILLTMVDAESDASIWSKYNEEVQKICEAALKTLKHSNQEYRTFKEHYAMSLNNFGFLFGSTGEMQKSIDYFIKSLNIRKELGDKDKITESLNNIGFIYYRLGDIPNAIKYHSENLKLCEETGNITGQAGALNNLALIYSDQGDIVKTLEYYKKSQKLLEKAGDKKGQSTSLTNIGFVYLNQGNVAKALEYYSKSLKLREELNDKQGQANSLNQIGSVYFKQGDNSKALDYLQKSLKLHEEVGDKRGQANSLNNIGAIFDAKKNTLKALEYYKKGLKIQEEIRDKYGIANSLYNIGSIYRDKNELQKALEYYNKSLKMQEEIEDKPGLSSTLNDIGLVYSKLGNTKKAMEFMNKSLVISKELGFPEKIKNAANYLSVFYSKTGNYKLALDNYELYIKMRDSLNNIETQKATITQQTQYEYDKKKAIADKEHELQLKQQEEKSTAEKARQNIIIASVSVVLVLVAVFSVFLYNRFKVTQRQKAIIELKEKETHVQKLLIEEKHKEITDSINYAERIQRSFLATEQHLSANLNEYFILFKPKDVVSGDFYWSATLTNGHFAMATADSTGHGVPGAIMSLLNITSLEKAIETETSPDKILNATRKTIIERLKKDGSSDGGKDGMDCSLCVYDFKNRKLFIAAAHNPVWIVRPSTNSGTHSVAEPVEATVIEIKPDKMPVGKHDKQDTPFTLHELDLQKGDVVYTLTDGFPDQFGGEKGKKFMSKNLRELLLTNAHLPMQEQRALLEQTFSNWKSNLEQVDDVTVIGIRI